MAKKLRKDMALGYLVEDNPSILIGLSGLAILFGIVAIIIGVIFLGAGTTSRLVVVGGGFALAGLGLLIIFVKGTTVKKGEIYLMPEQMVLVDKGQKQVLKRQEVDSFNMELTSYVAMRTARITPGGSVVPENDEGNENYISFVLNGEEQKIQFQIENKVMFNKFKVLAEHWANPTS